MLLWFKCVKRKWVKEEMSVYGGLVESSLNLRDVVGGHDSGDSQHIPTILYPNNRLFGQLFFFIIFIYSIKKNNNKKNLTLPMMTRKYHTTAASCRRLWKVDIIHSLPHFGLWFLCDDHRPHLYISLCLNPPLHPLPVTYL